MTHVFIAARVITLAVLVGAVAGAGEKEPVIFSAGFENGLRAPWGTGQSFDHSAPWWNSGGCGSLADPDWRVRRNGNYSLRINNPTPKAPEAFGTTQQPLRFEKGHRYRIEVWALGRNLASKGAVSLVVDKDWKLRPIELPAGRYDWTPLRGEFTWPGGEGQCRILTADEGQAWLDDITIVDLGKS